MMRNILLASAALATFSAAPASAALVDFEALPVGDNGNPLSVSGATFTTGGGVPESTTWTMMIFGFGMVGGALRRRKTPLAFA